MSKTLYVWGRVTPEEKAIIEKLAKAMNMKISEFIRYLIIQELERRSIITTKIEKLKEEIRGVQDE
ncbi:hypothetical protein DRN87_04385 [Candidatus Geothermarchaeota archaeon]|nr:MAG: hypothetical protein DRN87_04385 [Candidatus Geothermarchaeota archaeon]